MPINIYKPGEPNEEVEEIAWLCSDVWELSDQIYVLESWLETNSRLPPDSYIADIGYSVRKDALGGGGVFTVAMMKALSNLGIDVYFSEYPWGDD